MRIKSVHVQEFKRFTDLRIEDLPEQAKLVVVIGANGSGKSSLFDAFLAWHATRIGGGSADIQYFGKTQDKPATSFPSPDVQVHHNRPVREGSLYVRSVHRHEVELNVSGISIPSNPVRDDRIYRSIDADHRLAKNFGRVTYDLLNGMFDCGNNKKFVEDYRDGHLGEIQKSISNIFGNLALENLSNPVASQGPTGTFVFSKGTAKSYLYKNLSGGEKAAFDLILDMHLKKTHYKDAIYCIDEIEEHLHTDVQFALVKELYRIVPENAQLWLSTHSLGVLRAAQAIDAEQPGSVCLLDFDGPDFDGTDTVLRPLKIDNASWEKMLSLMLGDLSDRISPEHIVICEGSPDGRRRKDLDARVYGRIFHDQFGVVFLSGRSAKEVEASTSEVRRIMRSILPSSKVYGLLDQDDMTEGGVRDHGKDNILVLPARNLESLLFSEDVIEKLAKTRDCQKVGAALEIRAQEISRSESRGNAANDVKPASGAILCGLKKLLGPGLGNDTAEFMLHTGTLDLSRNANLRDSQERNNWKNERWSVTAKTGKAGATPAAEVRLVPLSLRRAKHHGAGGKQDHVLMPKIRIAGTFRGKANVGVINVFGQRGGMHLPTPFPRR